MVIPIATARSSCTLPRDVFGQAGVVQELAVEEAREDRHERGEDGPERAEYAADPDAAMPPGNPVGAVHVRVAVAQLDQRREDHDVGDRRERQNDPDHHVEGRGGAPPEILAAATKTIVEITPDRKLTLTGVPSFAEKRPRTRGPAPS